MTLLSAFLSLSSCADGTENTLSESALVQGFEEIHRKVYDVYGLPLDRDAIHALLDASFSGTALTNEYVEHFTTRVRMRQEETAIHIVSVDYDDVHLLDVEDDRYRVAAAWSVGGVVTHQGHKHTRVNRYEAVYTLTQTSEGLRIVDTRLRNLRRVRSALGTGFAGFAEGKGQGDKSSGGYMSPLELLRSGVADDAVSAGGDEIEEGEKSPDLPP
ncbi:MAG: hypothetical protein AAGA48_26845 [Myxococcota bacterium]